MAADPEDVHITSTIRQLQQLRYHGRWIFTKNAKNLLMAVQFEKTEINILQKKGGKKHF